jgi:hypothetical protein
MKTLFKLLKIPSAMLLVFTGQQWLYNYQRYTRFIYNISMHACILYTTKMRPCQVLKDAYKRIRLNFEKDIISLMSKGKEYQSFAPACILECWLTCCTVHLRKIKRHLIPQVSVMHATSELQRHSYFSPLLKPIYPLGFTCQTLV